MQSQGEGQINTNPLFKSSQHSKRNHTRFTFNALKHLGLLNLINKAVDRLESAEMSVVTVETSETDDKLTKIVVKTHSIKEIKER